MQAPDQPNDNTDSQADLQQSELSQPSSNFVNTTGPLCPGTVVGGSYVIIEKLGRGAMGVVYKAKHISLLAEYALKILTVEQLTAQSVARFQNEAQAIAQLNHPNIVAIFNFGLHNGCLPFYVMELVQGESLLEAIQSNGHLQSLVALPIFIEACAGLGYAHSKGILHRDLKPANLMLLQAPDTRGAAVKVVDFGIVKYTGRQEIEEQRLTAMGEVCGSPSYMSPEQACGQRVDPRSDVYSLGCTLFEALTGTVPFRGRSAAETMMMHIEAPIPTLASRLEQQAIAEDLETVVAKMLSKAPADRYTSMAAVARDLMNIVDGRAIGYVQVLPEAKGTDRPGASGLSATASTVSTDLLQHLESSSNREIYQRVAKTDLFAADEIEEFVDESIENERDLAGVAETKFFNRVEELTTSRIFIGFSLLLTIFAGLGCLAIFVPSQTNDNSAQMLEEKSINHYFSTTITRNGRNYSQFDFPETQHAVPLALIGPNILEARLTEGKVEFPTDVKLYLAPFPQATAEFFSRFRPGEITGVWLSPENASDLLFESATKLPELSQLFVGGCPQLTEKIVPSLCRQKLVALDIKGSSIDGALLAKANFWPSLKVLNVSKCHNLTPVLVKLQNSKQLEYLDISEVDLSPKDLTLISTASNLRVLNLSRNKFSAKDLSKLAKLKRLHTLVFIYSRPIGKSLAQVLTKFSALRKLLVLKGSLSSQDIQLFMKQSPPIFVEQVTKEQLMANESAKHQASYSLSQ